MCTNVTAINVPFMPCGPKLFAIVPLLQLTKTKPAQNAAGEKKEPKPAKTTPQGVINLTGGRGVSQTPTPLIPAVNKPTGTAPPTASSLQGPAPTQPPPPFYITLQGATTYDNPVSVIPQQHGVPYLRTTYKALPATWSGAGPIGLKVIVFSETDSKNGGQFKYQLVQCNDGSLLYSRFNVKDFCISFYYASSPLFLPKMKLNQTESK